MTQICLNRHICPLDVLAGAAVYDCVPPSADTDMGYHPPTVRAGPVDSRRVLIY